MPKKSMDNKKIYNSVVKIITTMVVLDLTIPFNIVNQAQAIGAGFFINNNGDILTAAHVVENAIEIWIKIPSQGQKTYKAAIRCVYPDFDLAIIKVLNFKNDDWLKLGNSDELNLRDQVYAIGYPSNPNYPIVTSGTISGRRYDYIQTDTPVNPGNSGGPILNSKNEVVGITSGVLMMSEDSSLMIPINIAKNNLKSMMHSKTKVIHKNVLGTLLVNSTDNYREMYNISSKECEKGIIIKKVLKKSPLYGQVEEGDVICSFNDGYTEYKIDYYGETDVDWEHGKVSLDLLVKRCLPRQKVEITVFSIKEGKPKRIKFFLKTFNEIYPIIKIFPHIDKVDYEIFGGMILMNLTINHLLRPEFQHLVYLMVNEQIYEPQLVITHIFPNSKISEYDTIKPYSLIQSINGITVNSLKGFRDAIKKPIERNGKIFITIETQIGDKVILNMNELMEQEREMIGYYKYTPSKIFDYFSSIMGLK